MEVTLIITSLLIKSQQCSVLCGILKECLNHSQLDCEVILEVSKVSANVKTQGRDSRLLYHQVSGDINENGLINT